jgi:predicted transglutaminase-like cysteine proteinase
VRQAIKTIVAVVAVTATATTIQQVARANFLPPGISNSELQPLTSAGSHQFMELLPLKSDGSAPSADSQQIEPSDPMQSDGPIAFMDPLEQIASHRWFAKLDQPTVAPLANAKAAASVTEPLQLASLEQSEPGEALSAARDQDLAPKRYASLEALPETDRSQSRRLGAPLSRIQFDTPALAPMAHTFFCLKYRDDCKVDKTASTDITMILTPSRRAELERVNAAVNRAIIPHPNTKGLAGEVWLISPKAGECHDYAVTKRHELLGLGWAEQDLLLAEVVTTWGEHHLVLVIRTSDGDLVADSLDPNIRPWAQTPYQWVRIQSPGNPLIWSTMVSAPNRTRARASGPANHS